MTGKQLEDALASVGVSADGEWSVVNDERTVTLHVAASGVGLNVARVRRLQLGAELIVAENQAGESYYLNPAEVFAISANSGATASRKAGFR